MSGRNASEIVTMLIRLASSDDLRTCGEIYAEAFKAPPYRESWSHDDASEMLGELLTKDAESCWVVEDEGVIVGFAFCTVFGRFRASIQEFAVAPDTQRKGFGAALMEQILTQFKLRGVRSVDLIANRNAPAHAFYQRFGFVQPRFYVLMSQWL